MQIKKKNMSSQNRPLGANIFHMNMYYIQYPIKKKSFNVIRVQKYLNNIYEILNNNFTVFGKIVHKQSWPYK